MTEDLGIDIPNTFQFMGQTWQIKPGTTRDLGQDLGICNRDEMTIYINPAYPTQTIVQTLFHEIVHSWEITLNMHLTEDQVDNLATSMIHWFKSNPEFIPVLIQDEDIEE